MPSSSSLDHLTDAPGGAGLAVKNEHRTDAESPSVDSRIAGFHRKLPGYAVTELAELPTLADRLGTGRLFIKVEVERLGLPAFKMLGASWATRVALESWLGEAFEDDSLSGMRATLARHHVRPTLTCATDGNHGRAVARLARLLGLAARVYVPRDMSAERQNAISGEGAEVVVVDGSYDEAVVFSAEHAGGDDVLVSDTSWPGYTHVPQAVVEGYSTMLTEIDAQLADAGAEPPDLVVVPAGVGALAAAVTGHVRRSFGAGTVVVLVEPIVANCIQQSILAGRPTTVPGPHTSIMAGLNCGEVSLVAWPVIKAGVDWSATIHDDAAREGMRLLAAAGYDVGECGAAGVGTLLTFDPQLLTGRERPSVLLISTEGPTDVDAFVEVVGRPPRAAM